MDSRTTDSRTDGIPRDGGAVADARAPSPPAGEVVRLVADGAGTRFDAWLARRCSPGLSRSRLQALMADGRVLVDGAPASARSRPAAGQVVEIRLPPPAPAAPLPEDIPLDVLYEDGDVVVVNKRPGVVVHPAAGHAGGTLVNALLHHCGDLRAIGGTIRPGIVHRLDKDTSGVMVVAKNEAALNALAGEFKDRVTRKTYLALVHHAPAAASGTITAAIGRDPRDRKRMAADPPRGRPAVTHWEVAGRFGGLALLRVRIETGRTHQIRVHLASAGMPVVGDQAYGSRRMDMTVPDCPRRQMLHAAELAFRHPADGREMVFSAPPPDDMAALLEALRNGTGRR